MINDRITIDLEPFGESGNIVLSKPTFRRSQQMKNALGKSMKVFINEDKEGVARETPLGDIEIIKFLVFVQSAPFHADLESFLKFCDKLDEKRLGSAGELFALLQENVEKLEGSPGPLGS